MSPHIEPMPCPLKIGLMCPATASIIVDGRCTGVCPRSCIIFNDPRDVFGARVGYRPDDYRRKPDAPVMTVSEASA